MPLSRFSFGVLLVLAGVLCWAPAGVAQPNVQAPQTDTLKQDDDSDGQADRGDVVEYNVMIENTGDADAETVTFTAPLDPNMTLQPGSVKVGPIALDDAAAVLPNGQVTVDVLANDRDGDAGTLDAATVTEATSPGSGTISSIDTGTGEITYDAPGTTGTDTFTYTVMDDDGLISREATVTVLINECPAAQDDAVSTDEDTIGTGDVLADNGSGADTDTDGGTLVVTAVNGTAGDVGTQVTLGSGALLTLNSDGTFSYDPNDQFESLAMGDTDTDTFTYTIDDGTGLCAETATVTVTINGVNDAPVANDDPNESTDEDTAVDLTSSLLSNDTDVDTGDTQTIVSFDDTGTTGTVTLNAGTLTYDPNGQFEQLNVGETEMDSFTYIVEDFRGVSSGSATVTVEITGVNDAPVAMDFNAASIGNVELVVNTGGLTATANGTPSILDSTTNLLTGATDVDNDIGDLSVVANSGGTAFGGSFEVFSDGSFTVISAPGYIGDDQFMFQITDGMDNSAASSVTMVYLSRAYFINNSAAGNTTNAGTSINPFESIATFNSANGAGGMAPAMGDRIFIFEGSGAYDGELTLLDRQVLEGEGVDWVVSTQTLLTAGNRPQLQNSGGGDAIVLGVHNTVRGLNIGDTPTGFGMDGTSVGNLVVNNVSISGQGGAMQVTGGGAFATNVSFDTFESTSSPGDNLRLHAVTGTLSAASPGSGFSGSSAANSAVEITASGLTFQYGGALTKTASGPVVRVVNSVGSNVTLSGAITQNTPGLPGGIFLDGNGGAAFAFTDINLNVASDGFVCHNNGASPGPTLSVAPTSQAVVTATGGYALHLDTVIIDSQVTFNSLTSTSAANDGVRIDQVTGPGTLSVTGPTLVTNATAQGVQVSAMSDANTAVQFGDVTVNQRNDDGVYIVEADNTTGGITFGDITIGTPSGGATGHGVNVVNSTADVTASNIDVQ